MDNYGLDYWLGIFGGNICYIVMLLALGKILKKTEDDKKSYVLLMVGMLIVFILLNPFIKEIRLLGIVSGDYGAFNSKRRLIIGIVGVVIPLLFMWIYILGVFKLKLYQHGNKYVAYIYHDFYFLFCEGLYFIWIWSSFLFVVAIIGKYKTSWDWIFGTLVMIYYIGGICITVLRQKTFVIVNKNYCYNGFKKADKGELKDIESVETIKGGIILYTKQEKLYIKCTLEPFKGLLNEKLECIKE